MFASPLDVSVAPMSTGSDELHGFFERGSCFDDLSHFEAPLVMGTEMFASLLVLSSF